MKMAARVTVALLVVVAQVSCGMARRRGETRPHVEFECLDSAECGLGRCCIIRPDRYSYPSCRDHGQKGDACRPSAQLLNTTLSYPDNTSAHVTNAHYILCACAEGLACRAGTCVDPQEAEDLNSLGQD